MGYSSEDICALYHVTVCRSSWIHWIQFGKLALRQIYTL
ncbi:unnamed protein product [Acanthoscelides obtectus]|uniref:Uncharacterized protein n=1 Tax=Acanthoscelides obtectus TaxID=200917 RepID=A0A9P0L3T4_ACAOB|nr:unnamed protein product [Acanthoscelides obtectus]CAK1666425.1 hypothetical protein AOBTE_LOCUS25321 [Acanthoscelides obtectus]